LTVRAAVVGHVEWVRFARVERVPRPGEIVHAREHWEEAAGGGGVAAVQLAKLAGASALFTALGEDGPGRASAAQFPAQGVELHVAWRSAAQRLAFTFTDATAERTITVMGERHGPRGSDALPWEELERADCVYLTAGDAEVVRAARRARVLVATPRAGAALAEAGVELDAVVLSARDADEERWAEALGPPPRLMVRTAGAEGGRFTGAEGRTGTWTAAPPPGPAVDSYGCGDSFAAGLTFALGRGDGIEEALALAARCGAACLAGRGPYAGQLRLG
jgi:ribokinase